jgi:hypothetical protein
MRRVVAEDPQTKGFIKLPTSEHNVSDNLATNAAPAMLLREIDAREKDMVVMALYVDITGIPVFNPDDLGRRYIEALSKSAFLLDFVPSPDRLNIGPDAFMTDSHHGLHVRLDSWT